MVRYCSEEQGFTGWIGAEIAFVGVLAVWGAVLAFRTRHVPDAFRESDQSLQLSLGTLCAQVLSCAVSMCLMTLCLAGVILIPVDFLVRTCSLCNSSFSMLSLRRFLVRRKRRF